MVSEGTSDDRAAYLAWCKRRALEYIDANQPEQALSSMLSDLMKNPATNTPSDALQATVGVFELLEGGDALRRWIEGWE